MKPKFDCVIFDFDGTLSDTSEGIFTSLRYAFSALGMPEPPLDVLRTFIGPSMYFSFHETIGLDEETTYRAVEKYREHYRPTGVLMCKLYDGIFDLLVDLKARGITLCVASTKPQQHLDRAVVHLGVKELFTRIVGSELSGSTNDKVEQIRAAMAGKRPIMVGDAVFDIRSAREVGIPVVAAAWGFTAREKLEAEKPDYIVNSVDELRALLTE